MTEITALIKDVIAKVRYESNITWLYLDINENIQLGNYEKVAEYGASLTKQSKALVKLNEKLEGNKVASELHTLISKRNGHMLDTIDVKFVKEAYGYVFDQI